MIRLSKLTDYAVVVLVALGGKAEDTVSSASLSLDTHLPEPTVSKVLKLLSKAALVTSVRGASGGYALSSSLQNLTIADVIVAIEGPIALTACVDSSEDTCSFESICAVKGRWNEVNKAIYNALDNVRLSDMVTPDHIHDKQDNLKAIGDAR